MKRLLMLLALCCAFSLAAVAQYGGSSSGSTSSDQTTTTKKSKKASGEMGKQHTVTGCLSGPNDEGLYTLTNGHYKKGLEVGGNDELKSHVGHEVKLTGAWASESELGAKETKAEANESKSEAKEKHMKVSKIDHISDTCTSAKAGKSGSKKKGSSSSSTPPSM